MSFFTEKTKNIAALNVIPQSKTMTGEPAAVDKTTRLASLAGVFEGFALFLFLPAITTLAIDKPILGLSFWGWITVLAVLAVIYFIIDFVRDNAAFKVALAFIVNVHRLVGDNIAKLPLGWFANINAGSMSRTVTGELMLAGEILAHMLGQMISSAVAVITLTILAFIWDWRLGLVFVIAIPLFILMEWVSSRLARKGNAIIAPTKDELADRLIEFASRQQALRSCGVSRHYTELDEANAQWLAATKKGGSYKALGLAIGTVFTQIIVVILITVAAWLTVDNILGPVAGLAFIGMSMRFSQTLNSVMQTVMAMEERKAVTNRIDEVITAAPLPEPDTSATQPTPGAVELEHVTFGYDPTRPVLNDVSLTVAPGTMCALVGPSGCGKTTVVRLISRFYETNKGSVKVSGTDVKNLTTEDLMAQLSLVFQDVYLFDDTLKANILIGRENATDQELQEAAELAGVTEIVARLPKGWDTPVGEGGRALSGGERQRVAIARALLKKAPIVLLDEATSALDPENEDHIIAATEKLREHATLIVIAHKLDTIVKADQIVQFTADGRVEGIGTHAELKAAGGTYASFWKARADARGWRLT